jgi:hypothetical protein
MKFKPSRKLIGVASSIAIALFILNPEIFALSFVISSIGIDVFLLFLTFQLKDQFNYLYSFIFYFRRKVGVKKDDASVRVIPKESFEEK